MSGEQENYRYIILHKAFLLYNQHDYALDNDKTLDPDARLAHSSDREHLYSV